MRIPANEVLHDLDAVLGGILAEATARLPLHRHAAGPPPRASSGRIEGAAGPGAWILPELARGRGPREARWRGKTAEGPAEMFRSATPKPGKGIVTQSRRLENK
jgi:hypothetical protein